ncbi:MAG: aldo/keto reductase [Polyangiaceae bacterium]|jgi:aryl-alcohol dehydrogenase-like predicted oxidoreductase
MTDLPTRPLGRTGFNVTNLGFGAMELRGPPRGPEISDAEAERVLNAVLDAGINLVDTSIDYGRSEETIGRFISRRRSEYFLASKCGCVVGGAPGEHVHTAENIRRGVENSLRLLKTDHLDLVQFHRSLTREEFEKDGALQEAQKLKAEGKVRFLGVSGTLPNLVEQIGMGVFDAFQIPYSALQRDHEDVITQAAKAGAGTIIRGGVARGAPTDWQRTNYMVPGDTMRNRWEQARLDELLAGISRIEFTLRFTLSHPGLSTTIVGTKNLDHLQENIRAAKKGPLPADVLAEAKRRLATESFSEPTNASTAVRGSKDGGSPRAQHGAPAGKAP